MGCTCYQAWWSVLPPPPCPMHGQPTYTFQPPPTITTGTTTVTWEPEPCEDCAEPVAHEGGILAAVDEWFHRHHRIPRWVYWPLCEWREHRLWPREMAPSVRWPWVIYWGGRWTR